MSRRSYEIARVRVDATSGDDTIHRVASWCREHDGRTRTVCFVNAYSIATASRDRALLEAINDADLSVPDGAPVAWIGRRLAARTCERMSGPDLMHHLLSDQEYGDIRHFVLGGDDASLNRLEFRYNRGGTRSPRV